MRWLREFDPSDIGVASSSTVIGRNEIHFIRPVDNVEAFRGGKLPTSLKTNMQQEHHLLDRFEMKNL